MNEPPATYETYAAPNIATRLGQILYGLAIFAAVLVWMLALLSAIYADGFLGAWIVWGSIAVIGVLIWLAGRVLRYLLAGY